MTAAPSLHHPFTTQLVKGWCNAWSNIASTGTAVSPRMSRSSSRPNRPCASRCTAPRSCCPRTSSRSWRTPATICVQLRPERDPALQGLLQLRHHRPERAGNRRRALADGAGDAAPVARGDPAEHRRPGLPRQGHGTVRCRTVPHPGFRTRTTLYDRVRAAAESVAFAPRTPGSRPALSRTSCLRNHRFRRACDARPMNARKNGFMSQQDTQAEAQHPQPPVGSIAAPAAPGPLPRPGAQLARLQRTRPGTGRGPEHPPAGAGQLPRDLRQQPGRVLHGPAACSRCSGTRSSRSSPRSPSTPRTPSRTSPACP
ncbi:hypothetical protein DV517_20580 [Streptomyces sp. S816]|nr:hypothetical protein DV517_20580 [Streptomyces sp. S816]